MPLVEQMTLTRPEHLVLMLIMLPSMELGDRVGPVNDSSKQGVGPA